MTATPLWFGPTGRPLFGWVHLPEHNLARGAVVLCPPLARELTSAQYSYRLLAERLAASGMVAVRFDYDGTGDSSGDDRDPRRVESWLASIGHAVDLARSTGAPSVSLVGMRVGALLAATAAARLGSIDAVVLWDPCSPARSFVREQAALQRLLGVVDRDPGGGTELPGFVFSAETVADLASLSVPPSLAAPRRVLLLTRPGRPAATELTAALGAPTEDDEAIGQDLLLEVESLYHEIPNETIGRIVSWMGAENGATPSPVSVRARDVASMSVGGAGITERMMRLGPIGLFAIASEPATATGSPTVLMLNSGNDWHVGPHRLWVDLSRRWAAAGFRCVRFDESGLGDSPVRPGLEDHVVRAPEAFDDVAEAVSALEPDDPGSVILVGLCSGGYQALENALIRAPRAVYAINPILHFRPPELDKGPIDPRRQICQPATGLAQAYRWLQIEPVRRRLRTLAWRFLAVRNRRRKASTWLGRLDEAGVRVLVICGEDEARPFGDAPAGGADAGGSGGIRFDVIADLDHALVPASQRAVVIDRMTEDLLARFSPGAARVVSRRATA
jgi:alpha-beta hydrolase superfamily lysophospholipase